MPSNSNSRNNNLHIIRLECIDSTNTYAKNLIEKNAVPDAGITAIIARRQTAGRGRQGRSFFSDIEGGLWVSLIIKIEALDRHFSINRALSLAICDAVSKTAGTDALIKWPNDIYCNNRKICGILLETAGQRSDLIIAGFGLNVNIPASGFPLDLADTATSIQIETGAVFNTDDLFENIVNSFIAYLDMEYLSAHSIYSARLYRIGARVEISGIQGIFEGVETDGRLRINTTDGLKHVLSGTLAFNE